MTNLSSALSARYNRIMFLTLVGVLLVAGVLAYLQFQRRLSAETELLSGRMHEYASALDAILKNSSDAVKALQIQAQTWYATHPEGMPGSPLLAALAASRKDGAVNLDKIPAPWTREDIGNLTGSFDHFSRSLDKELGMALALNGTFKSIVLNNPSVAWVYYTSARSFINIYPWVSSTEFRFSPALHKKEFFYHGLTANDPLRSLFWTAAYLDAYGKGMMVTVAAPVYEGDQFRGTVALDLTLGQLNTFVRGWQSPFGTLFVVNDRGQLLAHPSLIHASATDVVPMRDAFPAPLRVDPASVLSAASAGLSLQDGYYVRNIPVTDAPFSLVMIAPRSDLVFAALRSGLFAAILLIGGLILMLIVATWLTHREFIRPSQQLVRYIEEEARGPAVSIPQVASAWRPWFETIRRVFNAHTQLVSIQQELDVARRMQQSIVPTRFPDRPDVQIYARMIPAKEVGGDFYDYFWLDDFRVGLVIADVSGKGVPAALFMAVSRTLLRATAPTAIGPGDCLQTTNNLLSQDNDATMFVTLFYGILDTRTGRMNYVNGGHTPPYLVMPDGAFSQLPNTGGMALGVMEGIPYQEGVCLLQPGTTLLLYTDGVTEAFDADDQEFSERRLEDVLKSSQSTDVEPLVGRVFDAVEQFAQGVDQADDITSLAVRFSAPTPVDSNRQSDPMTDTISLRIANKVSEIPRLVETSESFLESHRVVPAVGQIFSLAFDEIVTNIAAYAHDDAAEHAIDIRITVTASEVSAEMIDDGIAFDPRQAPKPDTDLPVDEREVGGLGIFLVTHLMDRVNYERRGERNHLTFAKKRRTN